jgi:hypothetical protein
MSKTKKDPKKSPPQDKKKEADEKTEQETEKTKPEEGQKVIPALDFSSLVLPFFTHALITLGQIDEKSDKEKAEDMELVKRLIDLLDMFKNRTEGNLKPEEKQFLDSCLHQLRMAYMEKTDIIKI